MAVTKGQDRVDRTGWTGLTVTAGWQPVRIIPEVGRPDGIISGALSTIVNFK